MRSAALLFCSLLTPTAWAASFIVDRLDDAVDQSPGDGQCLAATGGCTLRAAVQEGNALAGADEVILGAGTHTLSLAGADEDLGASGDLDISDALSISGVGTAATLIDASALDRVLDLLPGVPDYHVSLQDLTLRNGRLELIAFSDGGAGMRVGAGVQLQLDRVDIRDNTAPNQIDAIGLSNRGCVTGNRVRLLDNLDPAATDFTMALAGAIAVAGEDSCLTLIDSEIRGNQGSHAGAIRADEGAPFTLRRSLVTANSGGASGAFLLNNFNDVLLENVTVSGNLGDGAILVDGGALLTVINSTITNNTGLFSQPVVGGIHDVHGGFGRTFISNTILSGNGPGFLSDDCRVIQSLDGGNILGDSARCQHQTLPSDQLDVDPGLGLLADNGGPTQTHLPGPNAIDHGVNSACLPDDQRGLDRPQDGDGDGQPVCDVGAVEAIDDDTIFADGYE